MARAQARSSAPSAYRSSAQKSQSSAVATKEAKKEAAKQKREQKKAVQAQQKNEVAKAAAAADAWFARWLETYTARVVGTHGSGRPIFKCGRHRFIEYAQRIGGRLYAVAYELPPEKKSTPPSKKRSTCCTIEPCNTMLVEIGAPASNPDSLSFPPVGDAFECSQDSCKYPIKAFIAVDARGDCILPKKTFKPKHFSLIAGSIEDRVTRMQVLLHLNDALQEIEDLRQIVFIMHGGGIDDDEESEGGPKEQGPQSQAGGSKEQGSVSQAAGGYEELRKGVENLTPGWGWCSPLD